MLLVADDESSVRIVLRDLLEDSGFEMIWAEDGVEAVELFRRHQSEITAVLLDMTMPRLDGLEAFRELRSLRADVPVVLMSGYDDTDTASAFSGEDPPAQFVKKPFQLSGLLAAVEAAIEGS